jgi:hypothetical protein
MKIFGYTKRDLNALSIAELKPSELAEVTLCAQADELRKVARFFQEAAERMEENSIDFEHEHLSDKYPEFNTSPHVIVFNPKAM